MPSEWPKAIAHQFGSLPNAQPIEKLIHVGDKSIKGKADAAVAILYSRDWPTANNAVISGVCHDTLWRAHAVNYFDIRQ